MKLKHIHINQANTPPVVGADGSDLGAMGTVTCELQMGGKTVSQEFIVCRQLRRNLIVGVDFAKRNCAGVSWSPQGTRILTIKGQHIIEVAEDELGIPVTTTTAVKIPPRHIGTIPVEIQRSFDCTQVITPNRRFSEDNPYIHQGEISVIPTEGENCQLAVINYINLDTSRVLRIPKGEVVGFAHDESTRVEYIQTAKICTEPDYIDIRPRNWIPRRNRPHTQWKYTQDNKPQIGNTGQTLKRGEDSPEHHDNKNEDKSWMEINEVIESDFLISPGDIYPNRKVELEDAPIKESTKKEFERICQERQAAFSKNNKDIGRTQLIEMEIDTGDSLPVAQSPYTLPLKHYDWVRNEIETLEKAGVIERSLSPWASPVIVVPKKSAPDEPPRRRLCVDYRKVNNLQQEVKKTDRSTGCLSLYPLPKIDELLAKLNGAKIFSTIDLRSGYYHIGLTRESRAKSAFVVPMGKWEFSRTPFGLSQAPAYFQLLINKVLMECGKFAMGYLDDIIIFSQTEEDHLDQLENIFLRLEHFGLKMKREKCAFFKQHIQYLGHLISEEGIKPLPEKLQSIREMPAPRNPKEIKQFLGLLGYYRKFIPRFADISRPLTLLTRHDVEFDWTDRCQKSFEHLRALLMQHPILKYPDQEKPYMLFTDASKIGWSGVLTQPYWQGGEDSPSTGKKPKYHPVCYVSGLFRGSQLNWAALTKEAYAIYMSVKKLTFYITEADVTVRSDHLPLKKFLEKRTMNAKVNNWAVELEQFKIKLDWVPGTQNTLADALSRLMEISPEAKWEPEPEGYEFGATCFDELDPVKVHEVFIEHIDTLEMEVPCEAGMEVKLPIPRKQMVKLQKGDSECRDIVKKLRNNVQSAKIYFLDNELLIRLWTEEKCTFKCLVVPKALRDPLLMLCHNKNGHNGARRSYQALKRSYYWPNMRKEVYHHCKHCIECNLQNQANTEKPFSHFAAPEGPMQFICMDIVGPISPMTSRGNRFCLTVVCMLTGYTIAIPIPNKSAETICQAYRDNVYCTFGGSSRILTDNGTEFKNKEFDEVCETLGIKRIYSPVYTPEANGKLEGYHKFFKACVAKHIRGTALEWDELVPMASAAYNFFPCQSSRESPFVLMFGRDPITPFASLLEPTPRFWGERGGKLQMDALKRLYLVTAENLKKAREKEPKVEIKPRKLKIGDLVLVKDVNANVFEPRYTPNYRVTAIYGSNRIEVTDPAGKTSVRRSSHVKRIDPVEKVVQQVPNEEAYRAFGRATKLLIHPNSVPDLKVKLPPIVETEADDVSDGENDVELEQNEDITTSLDVDEVCRYPELLQGESSPPYAVTDTSFEVQNVVQSEQQVTAPTAGVVELNEIDVHKIEPQCEIPVKPCSTAKFSNKGGMDDNGGEENGMWYKFVTLVKSSVSTTDTSSCKCSAEQTARFDLL